MTSSTDILSAIAHNITLPFYWGELAATFETIERAERAFTPDPDPSPNASLEEIFAEPIRMPDYEGALVDGLTIERFRQIHRWLNANGEAIRMRIANIREGWPEMGGEDQKSGTLSRFNERETAYHAP